MTVSRLRPAFVIWLVALLALIVSGWILLPFPRRPTGWEEIAWAIGFGAGFTTVGAILVDRRPREQVSRITFAIGLLAVTAILLRAVSVALDAQPGDIPLAGALAGILSDVLQTIAFLAGGAFLLVRFPNGREPGRLSDAVDVLVGVIVVGAIGHAFVAGPIPASGVAEIDNPIGLQPLTPALVDIFGTIVLPAYAISLVLTAVVLLRRYRRAEDITRAQIRWVAAAGVAQVVLLALMAVAEWAWTVWFLSTALLPVAIGIAILRYRLFAIDRIIGRGVAYGIVTAVLAALFVVSNLALQALLAGATGAGTLVVAASTLVVAALFQPIRRAVQTAIDRRFNRRALDAERVVGQFTQRTRDEVDIERLRGAVVGAASEAVAPARASVWLRDRRART
jgi:hypothetical protein